MVCRRHRPIQPRSFHEIAVGQPDRPVLTIALALAACSPGKDAQSADAAKGAPAAGAAASDSKGAEISGAGASFIYPLVSKWSADYNAATGNKVNYQSIGSGGGIAQIKAGTVDFGSTDKPLDSAELQQAGLGRFRPPSAAWCQW